MALKVLITKEQIERRVRELADEVTASFAGRAVTVVSVLKGAVIFTADLIRCMRCDVELDFVRVKSYRGSQKGSVRITYGPELDLNGRSVLVVDDIYDTGESLQAVHSRVMAHSPAVVKTCVLLKKQVPPAVELEPDFVGFTVPNHFVVGYGLDIDERYRNLDCIGYIE